MSSAVPLMSYAAFKRACIQAIAAVGAAFVPQRRMRFDDEVIRKLRATMLITAQTRETLEEALTVMVEAIANRTSGTRIRYAHIEGLLALTSDPDEGEAEWVPEGVRPARTWQVRRILARIPHTKIYVVDWEPTEEPATNIPRNLIAAFENERRALVRAAFIEDQAVEA